MNSHRRRSLHGLRTSAGVLAALATLFGASPVHGQVFSSGSTGTDGPFNPTCAPRPCTVTVALPESGVFNFTTVVIPDEVIVKFTRNSRNTSVTILATGDIQIDGMIDISGESALDGPFGPTMPGRGGPGGFDGGLGGRAGTFLSSRAGSAGLGPGGGLGADPGGLAGGGGFRTAGCCGTASGPTYGVHTLLPVIGGSGGGGAAGDETRDGHGGGGGGGAILIASSGTISLPVSGSGAVTSSIMANGGHGSGDSPFVVFGGGCGAGGGVRLVANRITGHAATIALSPGTRCSQGSNSFEGRGGSGRVRVEAYQLDVVVPLEFSRGTPGPLSVPALRITSVGGIAAPDGAQGTMVANPDIVLAPDTPNPVIVGLSASGVPAGTIVELRVASEGVATRSTTTSTPLTGTLDASTATATISLPNGTSVITATVTFAFGVAGLGGPTMIGGEEIKLVRVATSFGGKTAMTYITVSGRELSVR